MQKRQFPKQNYKAVFDPITGETLRFRFDNNKPIGRLAYPEILDISLGTKCLGHCSYCYANSDSEGLLYEDCVGKIKNWFGRMSENERPFQVAIGGGGEPTLHPEFIPILISFKGLGIVPNYTTNGMHLTPRILEATSKYCGGVAVSCHEHLLPHWIKAVETFYSMGIKVSLHVMIGHRRGSVAQFWAIYDRYVNMVSNFVLLPYQAIGRGETTCFTDLELGFLLDTLLLRKPKKVAFGALLYETLKSRPDICEALDIAIYEPEVMSGYVKLDTVDLIIRKSSFDPTPIGERHEMCKV